MGAADIVLNGFGDNIDKLCKELADTYKVRVTFAGANLSEPAEIENMFKELGDRGVDILVNNAGIQHVAPVQDFPVEAFNKVIAINLSAVFHTTRLALPAMQKRNWGECAVFRHNISE